MKVIIFFLSLSQVSFAAIQDQSFEEQVFHSLREPHAQAVSRLKTLGAKSLDALKKNSFNSKLPMKTRWKSFMVLAEIQGKKSFPEIKRALLDKTWYMRSAGLTAMHRIDSQAVKKWAYQKLNNDPALMVRMKALEILQNSMTGKVTELFWKKLYSKDSYHMNKGLWIRSDLLQALSRQPRAKDLSRWARVIHEENKEHQKLASHVLSKINNHKTTNLSDISYWQKKYPKKIKR